MHRYIILPIIQLQTSKKKLKLLIKTIKNIINNKNNNNHMSSDDGVGAIHYVDWNKKKRTLVKQLIIFIN